MPRWMSPRYQRDWKEGDVVLGTIQQRRLRWQEPKGRRRREQEAVAERTTAVRDAGARAAKIVSELTRLRAVVEDGLLSDREREDAVGRIQAYWRVHQETEVGRLARPDMPLTATGWVRISQAAAVSGLPARTLRRWCRDRGLPAKKRGAFWYVNMRELRWRLAGDASADE
jgi:hypothetical protein